MKNLKIALFSLLAALFLLTSCTNNEPIDDSIQQTDESTSITTALNALQAKFNANGTVAAESNPAGNIVLDFCFDFVYPLTLSYNNGATVTVNDLDGLIDVMLGSTDELFINGIAFPFDVETFDDDTDTIEIETIEDEDDFIELILSCGFDDIDDCACYEVYDPVCVEVTDPNGDTFIVTYPNDCYALCDGFEEDDFIEDCTDDYYTGGFECFELNYPVSVITESGEVITINSEDELSTTLYDTYVFDFVYPFTVTVFDEDDDETEVVTINNAEDFEDVIEDCYEFYYDDDDFYGDCDDCENEPVDPVCVQFVTAAGDVVVEVFPNACIAECLGYDEDSFVDCANVNDPQSCGEDNIVATLTECEWYGFSSLLPQEDDMEFNFETDGTLTVDIDDTLLNGTWQITTGSDNTVFFSFAIPEPLNGISNLDWTAVECNDESLLLESNGEFLALEKDCD